MANLRLGTLAALGAAIALLVSACASVETPDPKPDLLREYIRSPDVKNDRFPSMGSPADRLANMAANGPPEQILNALMSPYRCAIAYEGPDAECQRSPAATEAATEFAGSSHELYGRTTIVKRADGSLELLPLFVARDKAKNTLLIDSTGTTYPGGLDDFIEHNDLLSPDDVIFAPQDVTAVAGGGKVVTVYGRPVVNRLPWVLGVAGAVVVLGILGGWLFLIRRRRDKEFNDGLAGMA